ncbi:uncharacterized protein [Littorina saxatilis]|uniref:Uncharacterized protein n=1 Tax=Littorina saxatilis TaxID=31220 RepID=A0AAN9BPC9_9CAEN
MGNCESSRKAIQLRAAEHADVPPVLAKIRAAQQQHFDKNIEGADDDSSDDDTSSSDNDSDRHRTFSGDSQHAENIIQKAKDSVDGIIHFERRGRFFSVLDKTDRKARSIDPMEYEYPFHNIVLEGGGNKGIAYCGAVRVLEETGLWGNVRGLAGASAGAMTAALLAVGYNSYELEEFLSQDLSQIFLDHKCGYCSLLPNLLTGFGWNPGKRIYKWFGDKLNQKCGNADITFKEVLEKCGKELCVVVTNLNQMSTEYCHPKTTPDMAVRMAVRMSMAIPGLFRATRYTNHGQTDIFVDGGVLCNYPIHCFDGWWLSMKQENSFLKRLQPLDNLPRLLDKTERFGAFNENTLGFLLFADNERELFRYQVEHMRHGAQLQGLPNTKLARAKLRQKKLQDKTEREHRRLVKAVNAFLKVLEKHNVDNNDTIDRAELEAALKDEKDFKRKHRLHLFGDVDSETILQYLDRDGNGQICYQELVHFMEETGINIQLRFLGYQRREVKNFFTFLNTLQSTLLTNVKKIFVEERDIERTVGINTGHVDTSDFVLEDADRDFLVERGRLACESFLKYYAAVKNLPKKNAKNGDVSTPTGNAETPLANNNNEGAGDAVTVERVIVVEKQTVARLESLGLPYVDDETEVNTSVEVFEMINTDEQSPFLPKESGT